MTTGRTDLPCQSAIHFEQRSLGLASGPVQMGRVTSRTSVTRALLTLRRSWSALLRGSIRSTISGISPAAALDRPPSAPLTRSLWTPESLLWTPESLLWTPESLLWTPSPCSGHLSPCSPSDWDPSSPPVTLLHPSVLLFSLRSRHSRPHHRRLITGQRLSVQTLCCTGRPADAEPPPGVTDPRWPHAVRRGRRARGVRRHRAARRTSD